MELRRYVTIGQYIPRPSPVHRLDPRTKIVATGAGMVAVFLIPAFWGLGAYAAFVLALFILSQIPVGYVLRGLRPVLVLIALTLVLQTFASGESGPVLFQVWRVVATWPGFERGLFVSARLLLLVAATSLLTYVTSPVELTDGLERLLAPFRRVGLPAHELAMMMTIALRFIPTLLGETEKIMRAQMARGAELQRGGLLARARALVPILVPLFVSAFRRADELAMAMEARGYHGGEGRTRMKQLRLRWADAVALAVVAAVSALAALPASVWKR